MKKKIIIVCCVALAIVLIALIIGEISTTKKSSPVVLSTVSEPVDIEPITDNLMSGLNANDYTIFSKDFNEKMKSAFTKEGFDQTYKAVHERIGNYVSRSAVEVSETDELITVVYSAKFEKEDGVTLRVIVEKSGDHHLAGLWIDSPDLRKK
jgi:uncharacterized protein YxeA